LGTHFKFNCTRCRYTATVSGGLDYGMVAVVQTKICLDCRELVDVLIGARDKVGDKTGAPERDAEMNLCPLCQGKQLETWPETRPCPRCNKPMQDNGELVEMWD